MFLSAVFLPLCLGVHRHSLYMLLWNWVFIAILLTLVYIPASEQMNLPLGTYVSLEYAKSLCPETKAIRFMLGVLKKLSFLGWCLRSLEFLHSGIYIFDILLQVQMWVYYIYSYSTRQTSNYRPRNTNWIYITNFLPRWVLDW